MTGGRREEKRREEKRREEKRKEDKRRQECIERREEAQTIISQVK